MIPEYMGVIVDSVNLVICFKNSSKSVRQSLLDKMD